MQEIIVHTDGASRGNPGKAAIAYTITGLQNLMEFATTIGVQTNNQAEYQAMVAALEKLCQSHIQDCEITIFSDSELMVKQINGEYRVKHPDILPVHSRVSELIKDLKNNNNTLTFKAIRREFNKRADALANMALDGELNA